MAADGSVVIDVDLNDNAAVQGVGKLKKSLLGIGKAVLTAGAVAGAAFLGFGYKAVQAAAEMNAMNSQFDQVFGKLDETAQGSIDKMASEFGMVSERIKPAFTTMTSMFKGLGMDTEEAMGVAARATTVVADSAAFYDKSFEEANGALNSFIKGNYEGGESIGLFANETQLAAYASKELGVDWKTLDEAGKQVARLQYAEAMQKAAGATGQASRESESLSNVQGNLQAVWQTLMAKFGDKALPLVVEMIQKLTEKLQQIDVDQVIAQLESFYEKTKEIVVEIKEFVIQWLPLIAGIVAGVVAFKLITGAIALYKGMIAMARAAQLLFNVAMLTSPITWLVLGFALLVAAGVLLWQNWDVVKAKVIELGTTIKTKFAEAKEAVITKFNEIKTGISTKWAEIKADTIAKIIEIVTGVITWFMTLRAGIIAKVTEIKTAITTKWTEIKTAVITKIQELITGAIAKFVALKTGVSNKVTEIKTAVVNKWEEMKSLVTSKVQAMITAVTTKFSAMKTAVSSKVTEIKTAVVNKWEEMKSAVATKIQGMITTVSSKFSSMVSAVRTKMGEVKSKITGVWGEIKSFFSSISLVSIGKNIIQGLLTGIGSMIGKVKAKAGEIADVLPDWVKKKLGIHSPSRVMMALGKFSGEGFVNGVKGQIKAVKNIAKKLGDAAITQVDENSDYSIAGLQNVSRVQENKIGGFINKLKGITIPISNLVPFASIPLEMGKDDKKESNNGFTDLIQAVVDLTARPNVIAINGREVATVIADDVGDVMRRDNAINKKYGK